MINSFNEVVIPIKCGSGYFEIPLRYKQCLKLEEQSVLYSFVRELNRQSPPSY